MGPRIVYVALADARGHLMRAHIVRTRLAEHGVSVDIVTTSSAGQRFLAAMGSPAGILRAGPNLRFDGAHNLRRAATTAHLLRYLGQPSRMRRDRAWLLEQARGAAFVVSDSFHPALLFAPPSLRVVQVYGENILGATRQEFATLGPLAGIGVRAFERALARSFARVEHSLGPTPSHAATIHLPPIIPSPRPFGGPARPVAYLNPHFTDTRIARAIEGALGPDFHGVAEGFAERTGWRAYDPQLADRAARAPLFISGAGMGAVGMARAFGVPTILLLSDQAEQRANAAQVRDLPNVRIVEIDDGLSRALAEQVVALREDSCVRTEPRAVAMAIQDQWTTAFLQLIDRSNHTPTTRTTHDAIPIHGIPHTARTHRPDPGDQQPRGRPRFGLRTRIAAARARRAAATELRPHGTVRAGDHAPRLAVAPPGDARARRRADDTPGRVA
jgi:Glycosyltransferase family 28 C-terminal domain